MGSDRQAYVSESLGWKQTDDRPVWQRASDYLLLLGGQARYEIEFIWGREGSASL